MSESFVSKTYGEYDVNTLNHGLACQYNCDITNPFRACAGYNATAQPRLQNVATSRTLPGVGLRPPAYGTLHGGARVETAASGGIVGRGIYLDGVDDFIEYWVPQRRAPILGTAGPKSWFVGLWLNPKEMNDAHTLITLGDGTVVSFVPSGSQQSLVIQKAGVSHGFLVPAALALDPLRWTHLGINARPESNGTETTVEVYLDGYRLAAAVLGSSTCAQPFTIGTGFVRIGPAVAGQAGFDGWVDDFKVIQAWLLPTEVCGHAYGRLVGTTTASPLVAAYPPESHEFVSEAIGHAEAQYPFYYCERYDPDHFDYDAELSGKVCLGRDGTDPRCVTDAINFPEGPIYRDAPRPDSTGNAFCLRCHASDNLSPRLQVQAALGAGTTAFSASHDEFDRRRQPLNPPRKVFGEPGAFLESQGVMGVDPRGNQIDFLRFEEHP